MKKPLGAIKISEKVYWVGAIDWSIRNFHGYSTEMGTTYNAYLVLADKITLIDTVKYQFRDEMLSRISSVIDPGKIEIVISNHAEMDHSGSLPWICDRIKPDRVYASQSGAKTLASHFGNFHEITPVRTGDRISLGNAEISFIETKMLHWPDSMFSYLHEDQVLFSQDAFGMHLASTKLFDDEHDYGILEKEAGKYFANIVLLYSDMILKTLVEFKKLNIPVKMIAPDHGPVWRSHIPKILGLYEKWSIQKPGSKALVVYDTMWQSTTMMAEAITEGLRQGGAEVKVFLMTVSNRSDVATELLGAGAIIVGSPTLNNSIFPTLADIMVYMKGLRPKNLIGWSFGSYGWSGEAVAILNESLKSMDVEIISEGIKAKYLPTEKELEACRDMGLKTAQMLVGKNQA